MALRKNPKVDLKRNHNRIFETSLIVSLAFLIIAFKYFPRFDKQKVVIEGPQELVQVEDVEHTKQEAAPPPPPKPPIPIEAPSDDVLDDIEISETDLDVNAVVDSAPPPPPEDTGEETDPVFFVAVEELPELIGGLPALEQSIQYPDIALRAGIQGRVYLRAFVDERGDVKKVEVLKGIGAGCDEAAVQALMKAKFKPGRQRGKPVKVQISLPVNFKIR
ncbi:MAG: energy transducer TonB [Ignavibacteria bacterium RBG_13_36_8]|nr:MAG: energy transducer TonB [Ignavibacteria bacterium RBG_13_36_8]